MVSQETFDRLQVAGQDMRLFVPYQPLDNRRPAAPRLDVINARLREVFGAPRR